MADSNGMALLRLLRRTLTDLLTEALTELRQTAGLPGLGPAGPEWTGCGFEDRLLAPIAAGAGTADPVTARVIAALGSLARVGGPQVRAAGLFGWAPDPASPPEDRGIACALRLAPTGGDFAVALAVTDVGFRPVIDVVASGDAAQSVALPIDGAWSILADGRAGTLLEIRLPDSGAATVVRGSDGAHVRISLSHSGSGPGPGPGVDLGHTAVTATVSVSGGLPALAGGLQISGGEVRIAPGELSSLLPAPAPTPLDVGLSLSGVDGIAIAGSSTLAVRLPTGASVPGVTTGPLDVELMPAPDDVSVRVRVRCAIALDLPTAPIRLDIDGNGFEVPFRLGGGSLGFDPSGLRSNVPTGAGVALSLPVVSGAGQLSRSGDGYRGMLAVQMPPLAVSALGALDIRTGAFVVVLGAVFPPPGVQIGLGFAITGVGGIVGVGRRIDRDALTRAVQDGTAASLLFPTNPDAAARDVVPMLDRLFPPSPESVIVGPMFQISWGGRLLTGSVALIAELPDPVRLSVLGKVLLAIPDPALPLIKLQMTFFGQIDPAVPSLSILASLTDSTMAGIPITGDMFVLVQGGPDANVVVSAGGFHPRFTRPPGVPPLNRIAMTLSSGPFLQLRCSAYVAVTSNTLQFGALAELVAEVAGCGLRGHLGFDVLIQFSPFRFVAEISAAVAVEVFGETLVGIALRLTLEGPGGWRAVGRGRVDLFLFSASFDFDEVWGGSAPQAPAAPDIGAILADALAEPAAWRAYAPDPAGLPVQLTAAAGAALADGAVLHPHGSLSVRQSLIPLGIDIDRCNRIPIPPQRWDIANPVLGDGRPAPAAGEEREQFAPAAFVTMPDDAQLSRPAFEYFRAGMRFVAGEVTTGEERGAEFEYETKVISRRFRLGSRIAVTVGNLVEAVESVSGAAFDDPRWWRTARTAVTVTDTPAYAVVDAWSFSEASDVAPVSRNTTELHQAVTAARLADPRRRVEVAEAWEVAGL
ncbi:hypothetical protein E4P42_01345 [Mycobacterium sp. PS03-16]|uniref:DUF6603 domain-containing protein n=1 Tax=Mycobacterium sp. PS03-16 TaxID=2559611 RepID=UPI0010732D5D|nr:DUF6603 domain-containing protein [Mycobacterium sp. PS03-16]TFV61566.1 hypothetical protein E4P42_01345 [Mycobacterium sp. PS03-16]